MKSMTKPFFDHCSAIWRATRGNESPTLQVKCVTPFLGRGKKWPIEMVHISVTCGRGTWDLFFVYARPLHSTCGKCSYVKMRAGLPAGCVGLTDKKSKFEKLCASCNIESEPILIISKFVMHVHCLPRPNLQESKKKLWKCVQVCMQVA